MLNRDWLLFRSVPMARPRVCRDLSSAWLTTGMPEDKEEFETLHLMRVSLGLLTVERLGCVLVCF